MVFGCNGFVGTSLCTRAKLLGWEICGADMGTESVISGMEYLACDIRDRGAVLQAVRTAKPSYIVDVAAIADIDAAEKNRELAYAVNVTGAENIALASRETGAKFLFFSSDAVFDGVTGGYTEFSPKAFVNFYGQTKSEAEDRVLAACTNAVVIRISLVLGFSPAKGNSTLDAMARRFAAGEAVSCSTSDIRTPIDISTLCSCVLELYDHPFTGVIHLGSTESANRYEIACKAAQLLGYPESLVVETETNAPGKAPRHKKGIISVELAKSLLNTPLCSFEDTLKNAVASRAAVK